DPRCRSPTPSASSAGRPATAPSPRLRALGSGSALAPSGTSTPAKVGPGVGQQAVDESVRTPRGLRQLPDAGALLVTAHEVAREVIASLTDDALTLRQAWHGSLLD